MRLFAASGLTDLNLVTEGCVRSLSALRAESCSHQPYGEDLGANTGLSR
ncbi:hypothetical protein AK972_5344 [Pseudomonas yamanorum]|nr:hypothetical protein AK972_5344 [Pseudomonas yamanorum]